MNNNSKKNINNQEICVKNIKNEKNIFDFNFKNLIKPKEIKKYLDQYIIGQEEAKKTLSVLVYNHYKKIILNQNINMNDDYVELQKSNILLIGSTGTGKTLLAQTLASLLKVPFAIADATTLTEAGYVGDDVENILLRLIQAAEYNIGFAENGIIYIDEIDKISRKSENISITRDVSGEGVQQALLKIIEGSIVSVPPFGGRKHPNQENININTKNILFICGGAFSGIEKIINHRKNRNIIGFNQTKKLEKKSICNNNFTEKIEPEDLIKYGFIPELIGRLPIIVSLNDLDKKSLINILTKPKNAIIKQYKKILSYEGVELEITKKALNIIAEKALVKKTGARGLRSILEEIMIDTMYEIPSMKKVSKCIITKEVVLKSKNPKLI